MSTRGTFVRIFTGISVTSLLVLSTACDLQSNQSKGAPKVAAKATAAKIAYNAFNTNGQVKAMAVGSNGNVYMGGSFSRVQAQGLQGVYGVSATTGNLASNLSAANSAAMKMFDGIGTSANAGMIDANSGKKGMGIAFSHKLSDGTYIFAGDFNKYMGVSASGLVHVKEDGTLVTKFSEFVTANGGLNKLLDSWTVTGGAISPDESTLVLTGKFIKFGAKDVSNLLVLKLADYSVSDLYKNGVDAPSMGAYFASNTLLYIAGDRFSKCLGIPLFARSICAIDTSSGSPSVVQMGLKAGDGPDNKLYGVNGYSGQIFLYGAFDKYFYNGVMMTSGSGKAYANFVAINQFGIVNTAFEPANLQTPSPKPVSFVLPVSTSKLAVFIDGIGGGAGRIVMVHPSTGAKDAVFHDKSFPFDTKGEVVTGVVAANGNMYIAGPSFIQVTDNQAMRSISGVGVFSTVTGNMVSAGSYVNATGPNSDVTSLALSGDTVLIAGRFTKSGGTAVGNFAAMDSNGRLLDKCVANMGTGFDSSINDIAIDSKGFVYVAGNYSAYGSASASYIAKLDPNCAINETFRANSTDSGGFDGAIQKVVVGANGKIYVGGNFGNFDGNTYPFVAALTSDGLIDAGFVADPIAIATGQVTALHAASDALYVSHWNWGNGLFEIHKLSYVDATSVAAFNSGGPLQLDNEVYSMAMYGNTMYIGGAFTKSDPAGAATPNAYLASFNATSGAMDNTILISNQPDWYIYAMKVIDGYLVIGGDVWTTGIYTTPSIAAIDLKSMAVNLIFTPQAGGNGFENTVFALATSGSSLYVGGAFDQYRGTSGYGGVLGLNYSDGIPLK